MGLAAAAEVGDPMQISVASFVSALPTDAEVILAGGTQMMAVAALLRDMKVTRPLLVATTKYICRDSTSCFVEYAEKIGVDWYSAPLIFQLQSSRAWQIMKRDMSRKGRNGRGCMVCPPKRRNDRKDHRQDRKTLLNADLLKILLYLHLTEYGKAAGHSAAFDAFIVE